jgi:hypothetical protein
VDKGKKGAIAASAVGAAVVVAAIVYFLAPGVIPSPPADDNSGNTTIASPNGERPKMLLVLLEGSEDASSAVAQYEANNTEPIQLASGAHVRFDSAQYRTAESMRVTARDVDTGTIQLLRKSYNVNNEFFINLDHGHYVLEVQASWFERGSFGYRFDIQVV